MPWGAAIAAVGGLVAADMQSGAAGDAADAQAQASAQSIAEQRRQFDQLQANQQPYMQAGTGALSGLERLAAGDYSSFGDSPDYLYARDQMQQGIERGASARGALYNRGTDVDLARHLGGLASQNLGNYRGSLMGLASLGQNAAAGVGNAGMGMANSIGNLAGQQGAAQAQGAYDKANAWSNALGGLAGAAGQYAGNRSSSYTQPTGNWGAFAPNQPGFSNATTQPYTGGSAFGSWGQGWGA